MSDPTMSAPSRALAPEIAADVAIVAKGGGIQVLGQLSHRSLAFAFTVLSARVLGPAGFGLYQVILQLLEFGGQVGVLGFNYAATRFVALARARGDAGGVRGTIRVAIGAGATVSVAVVVAVVIAAGPIAAAFGGAAEHQARFAFLLRVGVFFVPCFALMQVFRYGTQAYQTMVPSVLTGNVLQPTLRLIVGAALFAAGLDVTAALSGDVASMAIAAMAAVVLFRRLLTPEERTAPPHADVRTIARFALAQSGAVLLSLQTLGLGVILLGLLGTNEEVGLFAIALALQGPADLTLAGVVNIWAPVVADLHERGAVERLDALFKTVTRWIATAALPVSAAIAIDAEFFARMLGGDRAVEAAPLVAILTIGNAFHTCAGPTGTALSMSGHPGVNFWDSLVAGIVYALLGTWAIPHFGVIGMAWVHTAVIVALNVTRLVQTKRLVGIQPFGRSSLKPAVATAIGAAALLVWNALLPLTVVARLGGLVVCSLLYLAVLHRFGVDEEERYVWELIKARLRGTSRR